MAFYKAKRDEKSLKEFTGEGSKYLNKPGIYDTSVIAAFLNEAEKSEAATIDFFLEYQGEKQPLYGNWYISKKDGKENESGIALLEKLMVILDLEELSDPEEEELPIGKDSAMKVVPVIPELTNFDVKIKIGIEYGKYNGNYTEKKVIKTFYRAEDGATADEIVHDAEEKGKQYQKDLEYFEQNEDAGYKYNDGVTKEEIEAWVQAKRPRGTAGASSSAATGTVKKPSFNKKRFSAK